MGTRKIVSLDIGNTLIRLDNSGFCTEFRWKTGLPRERLLPLFLEHFLTKDQPLDQAVRTVCNIIGYPNSQKLIDEFRSASAHLFEDTIEALEKISQTGVQMIGVSNCTPWEAGGLESLGLDRYLSQVFYSYSVGAAKPDLKIFKHVQATMRTEPQNILHVGDSWAADIEGARAAGWQAVFLNRDNSTIVPEGADPQIPVIESLLELPKIVEIYIA